jgi:hypothetical protein
MKKQECPICLQVINNEIITKCNHIFCDNCLIKYITLKTTCPICRNACDLNYIIDQIQSSRREIFEKEFNLYPDNTINHIQQYTPRTIYSKFMPVYLPGAVIMTIIFIIEITIIIHISFIIINKVYSIFAS